MKRLALFVTVAALGAAYPALAADPAAPANKRWKQADACIADANKQVPDHDAASQRKRDQLANACMVAHKLPPLTNTAPDDTAKPAATTPPSN